MSIFSKSLNLAPRWILLLTVVALGLNGDPSFGAQGGQSASSSGNGASNPGGSGASNGGGSGASNAGGNGNGQGSPGPSTGNSNSIGALCNYGHYAEGKYSNDLLMGCLGGCSTTECIVKDTSGNRIVYPLSHLVGRDGVEKTGFYGLDGRRCGSQTAASVSCPLQVTASFSAECDPPTLSQCKKAKYVKMFYKLEQKVAVPGITPIRAFETNWSTATPIHANSLYVVQNPNFVCPPGQKVRSMDNYGVPICGIDPLYTEMKCLNEMITVDAGPCGGSTTSCVPVYKKYCAPSSTPLPSVTPSTTPSVNCSFSGCSFTGGARKRFTTTCYSDNTFSTVFSTSSCVMSQFDPNPAPGDCSICSMGDGGADKCGPMPAQAPAPAPLCEWMCICSGSSCVWRDPNDCTQINSGGL